MSKLLHALSEGPDDPQAPNEAHDEYRIDVNDQTWTQKNVVNAIMGCLLNYGNTCSPEHVRNLLSSIPRDELVRLYNVNFGHPLSPSPQV